MTGRETPFASRDQMPLTGNPNDPVFVVMHRALLGLENVMAGSDGWGSEVEIGAIDALRHYLRLPEWCALCSWHEDFAGTAHTTFSHYVADERHWVRCVGPCNGCDEYEARA